ncbi:unnamed protein product, partial [Mesorhabditis belari]|uniref:Cytochrome P450 n=1 Tax=Mesorhabditis belari TaxID=2138241 RepID=A0AAF3J7I1_9BILA
MILFLLFLLFIGFLFYDFYWKRRGLPPGPTPLPIFGNLIQVFLNRPGYEVFTKWRKEYGPVFTFWLSFKPVFIVADYETIKESIIKEGDKYSDRYVFKEFNEVLRGGTFGLISSQGDLWREQRRFTLHTLRDFGMGRNLMEERIMIEVEPLMERMAQQKEDIFMQKEFDTAVGSIINNIVFGYRFDEQHLDEFELVKKALRHMIVAGTNPIFILSATLPFIRGWPIFRGIYSEVLANNQILFDFIQRQIDNRRKNVDFDTEEYDDFVECWLKEQRKKKGSIHEGYYTDIQLRNLVFDIWIAGMETTSNTLTWAVCYILNYPEVQRKMHEELDRVIKSDRKVTLADKNQLPYINAVVSEIQRLANLLPQNLMRLVTEDAVIKGYKIPAGSAVMPQIATILYDDKIFPDPYILKPERFLNPDGTFKTYPELVPFSVGKRQCPGFKPAVIIADWETIKESIIKEGDKYADRYVPEDFVRVLRGGYYGIINSKGDLWREQRRFVLHTLRDFGMGRNLMEERIMLEMDYFSERVAKLKKGINLQKEFDTAIGSIINNILFGYRFDEEHQHEFHLVKSALRSIIVDGSSPLFLVAAFVPITRGWPGFKGAFDKTINNNETMMNFIKKQIAIRRAQVDLESEGYDDFVECYLKEQHRKKGSIHEDFYCEIQLVNTVLDIWMAGMETTSNTLTWAFCYILNHLEVQEKIHEELDRVIKSDRKITMADKNSLPYLNAVVAEVQRCANLLPQNLIRSTSEDVVIGGYKLPAGTAVIPQIATVLLDEKVFPDPYEFNPDRFLNKDGTFKTYPELVPFSVGKRQCPGEGLARLELYLFIANILQRFKISADTVPSMEKTVGQVMTAKSYCCNFEERR